MVHSPQDVVRRLDVVRNSHSDDLMAGESLLSACPVGPISQLCSKKKIPVPLSRLGILGWAIHRQMEKGRARERSETLMQSIAHGVGAAVVELPEAARGCVLVLSDQRVLVYDRRMKQKVTECARDGVTIATTDHGLGRSSLVISNGDQRFAVAVDEGATEMARHFLASHHSAPRSVPITF